MNADRTATVHRYMLACAFALLFTVFLLFVMTKLIAPIDDDPVVTRMIRELELRRVPPPEILITVPEFVPPPKPELPDPDEPIADSPESVPVPVADGDPEEDPTPEGSEPIDWWAAAQEIAKQVGEDDFEKWLSGQDPNRYVSIMQGPIPTTGGMTRSPDAPEGPVIYRQYGDTVIQISDNCEMRLQSTPGDYSSFARSLPPLITCSEPEVMDMSGLEDYLQGDRSPEEY